ncbi:MAG: hypothetical protein JWQ35_1933, partial [Bacteriovoracaceae bacterium]|nr:hypothetical protein [Bacteriovoracaceae bacterium]
MAGGQFEKKVSNVIFLRILFLLLAIADFGLHADVGKELKSDSAASEQFIREVNQGLEKPRSPIVICQVLNAPGRSAQTSLPSTPDILVPPSIRTTSLNLNPREGAYINHTLSTFKQNNRIGEILNLRSFNRHYDEMKARGKTLSYEEMLKELNSGGERVQNLTALAHSASAYKPGESLKEYLGNLKSMAKPITAGSKYGDIAGDFVTGVVGTLSKITADELGGDMQILAQDISMRAVNYIEQYGVDEMKTVLSNSSNDESYKKAINAYLAPQINATTDSNIDDLKSQEEKNHDELTEQKKQTHDDHKEQNKFLHKLDTDYKKGELNQEKLMVAIAVELKNQNEAFFNEMKKQWEKGQNDQNQKERLELGKETYLNSIELLSNLARIAGNSEAAQAITFAGQNFLKINDNFNRLSDSISKSLETGAKSISAAELGMMTFNFYASILNFAIGLSALLDPQESSTEVILKAMREMELRLTDNMVQLSKQASEIFIKEAQMLNVVDLHIAELTDVTVRGLNMVLYRLENQSEKLAAVSSELYEMGIKLNMIQNDIFHAGSAVVDHMIAEKKILCIDSPDYKYLTPEQFRECLAAFRAYASETSRGSLFSTTANQSSDYWNSQLDDTLNRGDIFQNFDFLGNLARKRFQVDEMHLSSKALPNPAIWTEGVRLYLDALQTHPELAKHAAFSDVEQLIKTGETIDHEMKSIAANKGKLPKAIIKEYRKSLAEVKTAIQNNYSKFIIEETQNLDEKKFELFLSNWDMTNPMANLVTGISAKRINPSELAVSLGFADRTLPIPPSLSNYIARKYGISEALKKGAISITYDVLPVFTGQGEYEVEANEKNDLNFFKEFKDLTDAWIKNKSTEVNVYLKDGGLRYDTYWLVH